MPRTHRDLDRASDRRVADLRASDRRLSDRRVADLQASDRRFSDRLARVLETPQLAQIVERLPADVLHRVIEAHGFEECAGLVAIATPAQLEGLFDLGVWQPARAGTDERLDSTRLIAWLELLMATDAAIASRKLASLKVDLVVAAFAEHVRVFDLAVKSSSDAGPAVELGGYIIESRRTDAWDVLVGVLQTLLAEQPACFHRVMRGCRRLSNSRPEADGLHDLLTDNEQLMFDVALAREERREKLGYVTPAQARAFLQEARQYAGDVDSRPSSPIANAYFRALDPSMPPDPDTAILIEALLEAGIQSQRDRRRLSPPADARPQLPRLEALMSAAHDLDEAAHAKRVEEHAFLANAIVAGCSVQGRPFTAREASDAASAVCNLALENRPAGSGGELLSADFLVTHSLIPIFQAGWSVLYREVSLYAADELLRGLSGLRTIDRDVETGLAVLRHELARQRRAGTPWRARPALDVLLILDATIWAALDALLDECPVMHAAIGASRAGTAHAINPSAFEFISESQQISAVRQFMQSLTGRLQA